MKTLLIILVAVFTAGVSFGQMKNQPKVIVVLLGPANTTLSEANFPDLEIYSTPDLQLIENKKASKNTNKKAWSSVLGVGRTAGAESMDSYTGSPQELVNKSVSSGTAYLFDTEGIINAKLFNGETQDFVKGTNFLVKFNKMKRQWETETFGNIMKVLVKKGTTIKPNKKRKMEDTKYNIGFGIDNFEVSDKDGNLHGMHSLVKGNTATLVLFIRVNPEYDLNMGKESGADKKGKDYMNQVAQSVAAEKQIAPLLALEKGIFGKK